ncbi:M48 family metalloprotease [Novosphingobium soli]|uniref:M48 family metalloprotease n=1 Tax=Novosphingobium soli TaxID=574956 RepID=UPI00362E9BF6
MLAKPKGKAKAAKVAKAPAAPPVPTVTVPKVLADMALPAEVSDPAVPRAQTDLAKLTRTLSTHDFASEQDKALARYDLPPDKRYSYAIDHNLWVTEASRFERYVGLISNRLLTCWKGSVPPIRIVIDGHAEPMAFAHDSGVIRLSVGLLNEAENTDALAFTVAHEIAHVLYEHQAKRSRLKSTIERGFGALSSLIIIGRELQIESGSNKLDIRFRSEFGSTGLLLSGYSIQSLSNDAIVPFRRAGQEFEADRLAYDLVNCAKFSASGADAAVLLLGKAEQPDLRALAFAARLGAAYLTSQVVKTKDDDDLGSKLMALAAGWAINQTLDGVVKTLAAELAKAMGGEKRAAKLADYVKKSYAARADAMPLADTRLSELRQDPYWISLVQSAKRASAIDEQARSALLTVPVGQPLPDLSAAQTFSAGTIVDPRLPVSYAQYSGSRYAAGDFATQRQALKAGSRLKWGYRDLLIDAGKADYAARDVAALQATLGVGRERLGNVPELLPLDVRVALLRDDAEGAEKLAATCLEKGGDGLYAQCALPMGYDPACNPRTEGGKARLQQAVAARSTGKLLDLPALINLAQQSSPFLRCTGVTAATNATS